MSPACARFPGFWLIASTVLVVAPRLVAGALAHVGLGLALAGPGAAMAGGTASAQGRDGIFTIRLRRPDELPAPA